MPIIPTAEAEPRPAPARPSRHRQLHDQFRPAASGRARRAPPRPRARRRDHRAGRSAYRPAPPRHREAVRIQDLSPGSALFRPARLLLADVHGAQLRARHREIARPRSAAARAISARLLRRADPHLEPHAQPRQPRHGRRRDDAEPVAVRAARRLHELLRAGVGRAHARRLVPPRRRPPGRAAEAAHRHRRLARHARCRACSRMRSAWSPTTASSSSATSTSPRSPRRTRSPGASPAR